MMLNLCAWAIRVAKAALRTQSYAYVADPVLRDGPGQSHTRHLGAARVRHNFPATRTGSLRRAL